MLFTVTTINALTRMSNIMMYVLLVYPEYTFSDIINQK
jgi:hypothetical protein